MKLHVSRSDIRVPGFLFSGVACGLKDGGAKDVALIYCDRPAAVAGAFTQNRFAAPPVLLARERVRAGRIRAVLVNTKSANAGTGRPGLERARACCGLAAELLGVRENEVVPCSTGKIGMPLAWGKMRRGIRLAVAELSPAGFWDAAEAIRTTDAFAKVSARRVRIRGGTVSVAGLAKGAGMIYPRMATTLSYVLTDAAISPARLDVLLRASLDRSFNVISVDGDTSTNDTALLLASGASGLPPVRAGSADEGRLAEAVAEVFADLARMVVADGEGAGKIVEIRVRGARTAKEADGAARAVANSILVKTAIAGADPNWGRIACAVGYSGSSLRAERSEIRIGGVTVMRKGISTGKAAEARARRAMRREAFSIEIDLGVGKSGAVMWTSDLNARYVRFNSEYSS